MTTVTKVRPALQARSRRTLKALLDALDRLLQDRPFEAISVQEMARAAKVSTGAFYARFASKEDLLPELYARFQESLEEHREDELDPTNWSPLSAAARLQRLADLLCSSYEERPWLLRAMAIHSRRRPTPRTRAEAAASAQARWLRSLADCLRADPDPWPDCSRERVEFAIYVGITLAREGVLFPELPMARSLGVDSATLRERIPDLLRRQLDPPTPHD